MNEYRNTNRIIEFDIIKGISIVLIIIGHLGIGTIDRIVFTFHVPVFLIISGFFIKREQLFKTFIKSRFFKLIFPYLITVLSLCIIETVKKIIELDTDAIPKTIFETLVRGLYGSGSAKNITPLSIQPIGAIWFLLALFEALCIVKYFQDKKHFSVCICALFYISMLSARYIWLPFSIQAGISSSFFVYVGTIVQNGKLWITVRKPLVFLLAIVVLLFETFFSIRLYISRCQYDYGILSALAAVIITYSFFVISTVLKKSKLITKLFGFLGKNSLYILCIHSVELYSFPWEKLYCVLDLNGVITTFQYIIIAIMKLLISIIGTLIILQIKCFLKKQRNAICVD